VLNILGMLNRHNPTTGEFNVDSKADQLNLSHETKTKNALPT